MEYHKIDSVFKRDPATKHKTMLIGEYSTPEFEFLAHNEWVFTEKVDGTNIRVMIGDGRVTFGGRTDAAQIPAALVERLNDRFMSQAEALNERFPEGACLYGEGYGARIQAVGKLYRPDTDFVLFDVRVGNWWLNREPVEQIGAEIGCDVVPIIGRGDLAGMVEFVCDGFNSQWGDFLAEGVVARPAVELKDRGGRRIITKLKHRDFAAASAKSAA